MRWNWFRRKADYIEPTAQNPLGEPPDLIIAGLRSRVFSLEGVYKVACQARDDAEAALLVAESCRENLARQNAELRAKLRSRAAARGWQTRKARAG